MGKRAARGGLYLWAPKGRLIKIGGKLPVNLLVGHAALPPQCGATWQLRTQIAIIF